MGLFNRKEGGLMDVIRCDEEQYLVWKWRPAGQTANTTSKENAIRWGSSLRVKPGETAVFVYKKDGEQVMDFIVGPYDGTLKTENFPVLTSIVGLAWGGETPFQAEIYFFNLQGNNQIEFGVPWFDVADPRFLDLAVPVAVSGSLIFTLTDVQQFIKLNRLIDFDLEKFRDQISGMVRKFTKTFVTNCPSKNNIPVSQIERKIDEISDLMQARLAPQLADDFGVNLKRLDISAIEIDKASPEYAEFVVATKRQQLRRAEIETDVYEEGAHLAVESQNLQAHAINKQTEVLSAAAQNLGQMGQMAGDGGGMNPVGMMMGMGVAAGMGQQMAGMMGGMQQAQQMPQQPTAGAPVPPPVPGTISYMLAVNGQQYGPYNMQQMQQMAQAGQINAQSLVWCQGMASWEAAGNRPDLASLFAPAAPPMPPTA